MAHDGPMLSYVLSENIPLYQGHNITRTVKNSTCYDKYCILARQLNKVHNNTILF